MKRILFPFLCMTFLLGSFAVQAQNPYKEFGIEVEPLTLSKGKYNEFFTNDSLVRIGSVILDTRNNRITSFVVTDTSYSEATLEPEVSSRFLSPDPYAASYPNVSPYVYTLNNPVNYVDPTGMCPENVSKAVCVGATVAGTIKAGFSQIRYNSARRIAIWAGSETAKNSPYRRYGVYEDASSSTGVTIGYEEVYDDPSVGRRALDTGLAALDAATINPASSGTAMFAKLPGMTVSEIAEQVASGFKNLECTQCADALVGAFKENGISGQVIELSSEYDVIMSSTHGAGEAIARTGFHRAVLVDGMVYDNIHKNGIKLDDWKKDFYSRSDLEYKVVEDF